MKKRICSMFLCLCTVFALMSVALPTAKAATDGLGFPFDDEITANNPYIRKQTINGVTTYPCTLYVWQRVYNV